MGTGAGMMSYEKCPNVQALLAFAQDDDLPTTSEIAAHVEVCTVCADFITDVVRFPDIEPPPGWQPLTHDEVMIARDVLRLKTGGHLSMALLLAYYEGRLPPDFRNQVQEHLVTCETCADTVRSLASIGAGNWNDFVDRYGDELGLTRASKDAGKPH